MIRERFIVTAWALCLLTGAVLVGMAIVQVFG